MTGLIGVVTAIVLIFLCFKVGLLEAIDPLNNGEIHVYSFILVPIVIVGTVGLAYGAALAFDKYL